MLLDNFVARSAEFETEPSLNAYTKKTSRSSSEDIKQVALLNLCDTTCTGIPLAFGINPGVSYVALTQTSLGILHPTLR